MKKLILSICTVILFSNFVSAQSGVDLSNRFNMNGVHIDTSGRAIEVRSTRPEVVRLKNPLVAETIVSDNVLLWVIFVTLYVGIGLIIFLKIGYINYQDHYTYFQWLLMKVLTIFLWPVQAIVIFTCYEVGIKK